ncbi:E3 UFM1-protein ligase 1 homolog [Schistocerca gregaria]|uniref:E3 UFM1-protein ligase 1 homolog n=1 Tax=Schistocerca gregaria TaxID=7010 RepID=UPI00211F267B|nr:E3 UFM1-protein ligase 1 homolog [Schistocerca gregaria]
MTAVDWNEVKRLAADFQRAQLSSTVQRLSERNCIEIVTKLVELKLLDVIFTNDGKGYVTPQQLTTEIRDELYVHGGRINLVDLAKILCVDLSHISARAAEIERTDSGCTVVLGQLIDKTYLNQIAQEINDKLVQEGQVSIGELTRIYDLPADFLQSVVQNHLGKVIHAKQDKTDPRVFFTDSYIARNKACIRGALAAATAPIRIATLVKQCGLNERLFYAIIDNLTEKREVQGFLSGRQAGSSSVYMPAIFAKSLQDYADNFYKQNGYLDYDDLSRMGVNNVHTFVNERFPKEKLIKIKNFAVGPQLIGQIESVVEEAMSTGSWVDIQDIIPPVFEKEDAEHMLERVVKNVKNKFPNQEMHIFNKTVLVSDAFLHLLLKSFDTVIQKKAENAVSSGAYIAAQIENKLPNKKVAVEQETKVDRREERRKKAAGGKGGGGTQGRETKMKSLKKKPQRGHVQDEDSDEDTGPVPTKKLELLSISDIEEVLRKEKSLQDDELDELVSEIAATLHSTLNNQAEAAAQKIFESSMASTAQNRRKTHSELQEKLNNLLIDVRLFEKGLRSFNDKDLQQQLTKYLLKSLCTDIVTDLFTYVAQENMLQCDLTKELTAEARMKIINEVSNDMKEPLLKLHKSLSGSSVEDFMSAVEVVMGQGICDMIVRKPDKKKERIHLLNRRQSLLDELSTSQEPAKVLLITVLLIFQAVTQSTVHASGRFVNNILSFLQPNLPADTFNTLQEYYGLVWKNLQAEQNPDSSSECMATLVDKMPAIKEIANTFKKLTASERQQKVSE